MSFVLVSFIVGCCCLLPLLFSSLLLVLLFLLPPVVFSISSCHRFSCLASCLVLLPPVVWYSIQLPAAASRLSSLHSLSSPSSILFSLLTFTFDYYFVASKSISVLINKFTYRTTLHQRHTKEWLAATSSDNDSRSAKKKCVLIHHLL